MSAYSDAKAMYDEENFEKIVAFCAHNGIVHAERDFFICGYATHHSLIDIEIKYKKGIDKPDTWLVCIASGNLKRAFGVAQPLEFIAYERFDKKYRLIEYERMRRFCHGRHVRR